MKGLAFRKLSRSPSHRNHLLRNLVTSLITHERIVTTVAKAKEAARLADKMITLGKRNTRTSWSGAQAFLFAHKTSLPRLADVSKRYADRPGGYTRIHLMGHRKGDHAPRAVLELVDNPTDVKLDITARCIARETYIMLHRAQKNVSWDVLQGLIKAHADIPLEQDTRFHELTRKNIRKIVRFRGDEARTELADKAAAYLERMWASDTLEGPRRPDTKLWESMEATRPARGRTLTRPMTGRRMLAGQLPVHLAARVDTEREMSVPMRRPDRTVAPRRIVRFKKPSVVRLAKGIFAKRYVRGSATAVP